MKLTGNFEEWTVTQTALGRILNLTPGRINQLIDEKIVMRDEGEKGSVFLVESMQNYYKSKKAYYEDGKGKVDFWEERGLHERAKRKMAELKLRQIKGELYNAAVVEKVMCDQLVNFRSKILGLPNKLSVQLQGRSVAQINEILTENLEELLDELAAGYESAEFAEDVEEDEDG